MYKAAVNFLRGQVLVHIESGCPERVVNLCAGAEVPFWDVQWLSPVELTPVSYTHLTLPTILRV